MTTLQALAQNGAMLALLTVVAVGLTILIIMIARRLTGAALPARDKVMDLSPWDQPDDAGRPDARGNDANPPNPTSTADQARA